MSFGLNIFHFKMICSIYRTKVHQKIQKESYGLLSPYPNSVIANGNLNSLILFFQGGSSSLASYTEAELRAMESARLGLPLAGHILPGGIPGYPHPMPGMDL